MRRVKKDSTSEKRNKEAFLLAIYALSGGSPHKRIDPEDAARYVAEHRLLHLDDGAFERFHKDVVEVAKKTRT